MDQRVCQRVIDIQQDIFAIGQQKKIRDVFALRGQHRRVDETCIDPPDIIGDKTLQEIAGVGAGNAQYAAKVHGVWSLMVCLVI